MSTFKFFTGMILSLCVFVAQAQNATFEDIYNIMQVKCTGCHGGASPQGNLDYSGTMQEVYDLLVEVNPTNPSALGKGYKLVDPGYPKRSYMLHKLSANNWDDDFSLEVADGERMPPEPLDALSHKEIELVRQWILHGAPMNTTVVDPQILEDYYENNLALPTTGELAPPDPSEGYQIKFGPFFLAPGEEVEYFKKHELEMTEAYEVNELDVRFNTESHHFLLYQTNSSTAAERPEGLRNVNDFPESMIQNSLLAAWQDEGPYKLPGFSAYKVDAGNVLDLNYHLKNYDDTKVLAANVYINVYTQDNGTALEEMHSILVPINMFGLFLGQPLGAGLEIPAGGDETVFTEHLWVPDFPGAPFPSGNWYIWQLSTHTHARGTDYDIYLADANGQKGEQIYEGFYNYDYTFNQGYYDWEHPAIRYFEPLLEINMGLGGGIIHEAKYENYTDETLYWGNTTDDEMMLLFVHYTENQLPSTGVENTLSEGHNFKVYPNPYQEVCNIAYQLDQKENVVLEVYDLLGKKVADYVNGAQPAGQYQHTFSAAALGLPNGMYLIQLSIDGKKATHKIVEMH